MTKYEQESRELASSVNESQTRAEELQRSLTKARTKNEELSRIKREIETVLVEREKQVTTYEGQINQLMIDRNNEMESVRRRSVETEQMVSSQTEQNQSQLKKIEKHRTFCMGRVTHGFLVLYLFEVISW